VAELREQLREGPPKPPPTRWTLAALGAAICWLRPYSLSGLWRLLRALGLLYKRARHTLRSPDPDYAHKRDLAQDCMRQARADPSGTVTLYLDELTYYRQPSLARCWWPVGTHEQAPARLSLRSNTKRRIVGALNAVSGRLLSLEAAKIGVKKLVEFYAQIRQAYPHAHTIRVIQDNWPVHFHPTVQAAAKAHGIEMVALPTYAPWLNPMEKVWRKLKQEVLHVHRWSEEWDQLRAMVKTFLQDLAADSPALLRYTGLLPEPIPV
jgi:transposase